MSGIKMYPMTALFSHLHSNIFSLVVEKEGGYNILGIQHNPWSIFALPYSVCSLFALFPSDFFVCQNMDMLMGECHTCKNHLL